MKDKCAILMIHGILGTNKHFDFLDSYINQEYDVYKLILDGHNADVLSFAHSSMDKWKTQVETSFLDIVKDHPRVIIVAHSMGALFAIRLAIKYPDKISSLFLLQPALRIMPKFRLFKDCLKIYFGLVKDDDYRAKALMDASSITLDKKFYHYFLWIPRYLELFKEAKDVKKILKDLKTKTYIYQAEDDEMLSFRNALLFKDMPNVEVRYMTKSTHDYYAKDDKKLIIRDFKRYN